MPIKGRYQKSFEFKQLKDLTNLKTRSNARYILQYVIHTVGYSEDWQKSVPHEVILDYVSLAPAKNLINELLGLNVKIDYFAIWEKQDDGKFHIIEERLFEDGKTAINQVQVQFSKHEEGGLLANLNKTYSFKQLFQ